MLQAFLLDGAMLIQFSLIVCCLSGLGRLNLIGHCFGGVSRLDIIVYCYCGVNT